jgi:SAM-dependent methyltransferase
MVALLGTRVVHYPMTSQNKPHELATSTLGASPNDVRYGVAFGEYKLDIGCGNAKRPGFIGVDKLDLPGVDVTLDLLTETLPFDDDSVAAIYSAHFMEHVPQPDHVLSEMGRVCADGALIEIWTPYAFSREAFVYGHQTFLTELPWIHFCNTYQNEFRPMLRGTWLLRRVIYVVAPATSAELQASGVAVGFAVRYWKDVVAEFGVEIEYRTDSDLPPAVTEFVWTNDRHDAPRIPLDAPLPAAPRTSPWRRAARALRALTSTFAAGVRSK